MALSSYVNSIFSADQLANAKVKGIGNGISVNNPTGTVLSNSVSTYKPKSASPGATTTTPVSITTPQTSALKTPAAQAYVSSQMAPTNDYSSQQPLTSSTNTQNTAPSPTFNQNADGTVTTGATQKQPAQEKSSYKQAMDSYLASLGTSQDLSTRYGKEGLDAKRAYSAILDQPGGLLGGAQQSAALSNRRSNENMSETAYQSGVANDATSLALRRLELEQKQLPSTDGFSLSPGQQRYDSTGKLLASGGVDTPSSVQEYNFAKDQGYTGTYDEFKNGGGAGNQNAILSPTEAQALGVPYGTTRGAASGMGITPQKSLTETQARDLTYGTRGQEANTVIDQLSTDITAMNPVVYATYSGLEPNALGNAIVPDAVRQVKQAQRNFLTAVLRRESGASISPSEFSVAERQYFPRPGDDAKTLAQKAQARSTAINSFLKNAGQSGVQGGADPGNPFAASNFFGG